MGKQVYIYSTLATDHIYAIYEPAREGEQRRQVKKGSNGKPLKMLVKGGHGVANKNLITPFGVMTSVDAEVYELLKTNPAFLRHEGRGFISVTQTKKQVEKVAKDMNNKDKSKPRTKDDFKGKKPQTGSIEE